MIILSIIVLIINDLLLTQVVHEYHIKRYSWNTIISDHSALGDIIKIRQNRVWQTENKIVYKMLKNN